MPVCAEFADDKWDEEFMSELGPADKLLCPDDNSDDADSNDEDATAMEESPPRLKCLDEVISCLDDIRDFLENRGYTKEANSSNALLDDLARLRCASMFTSKTDFHY